MDNFAQVMSLKAQIEEDIKKAMLSRKRAELIALRDIKSAIILAETEKGGGGKLTADAELKVLMRAAKQRKESIETYLQNDRQDLADKEKTELEIIEKYLPEQMTPGDIEVTIADLIKRESATGMQDMGRIMGMATKELAGQVDGKDIAEVVKKHLSNS